MAEQEIYILDTNILFYIADYHAEFKKNKARNKKAKEFYSQLGSQIYILDLVWAEFLGGFLHKNINFKDYQFWYRNRRSAVEEMYLNLVREDINYISIKDRKEYQDVFELAREFSNSINHNIVGKIDYFDENNYRKKILDGMDAVIAVYAYLISQIRTSNDIALITADKNLKRLVNFCNEINYKFSDNKTWDVKALSLNQIL